MLMLMESHGVVRKVIGWMEEVCDGSKCVERGIPVNMGWVLSRRRNWEHPEVVVRSGEWPGWDPGRMAWYGGLWSHWRRLNDGVS